MCLLSATLLLAVLGATTGATRSLQDRVFTAELIALDEEYNVDEVTILATDFDQPEIPFNPAYKGYTILVNTDPTAHITAVEFYFDGGEWTEYAAPYSMAGGEGEILFPSPYLSMECGPKVVLVIGKSGSTVAFEEELAFDLACLAVQEIDPCGGITFRCPEYAFAVTQCPTRMEDCDCSTGYIKSGDDHCVPAGVLDDPTVNCFECPGGMEPTAYCPMSLKDCEMSTPDDYDDSMDDADKLPQCFTCPDNFDEMVECPLSIDDCERVDISTGSSCTFKCPYGMLPFETDCPENLDDCECDLSTLVSCPIGTEPLVNCPQSSEDDCERLDADDTMDPTDSKCFVCPSGYDGIVLCPVSIDDCEQYDDSQDDAGCFTCPDDYDEITECPMSIDDCERYDVASTSVQAACFQCPTGTVGINDCPATMRDCKCSSTFQCPLRMEPYDSICPETDSDCICSVTCPEGQVYANASPSIKCPNSPEDCVCSSVTAFQCPPGWTPVTACPQSIDDCDDECVRTGYVCPAHSVPASSCVMSMADCECKPGYAKVGEECVEQVDDDMGDDLDDGSCAFVCPKNSQASTNACPTSSDDCECIANFFWNEGRCDSCIVPGCKWMETYDFATESCVLNTYPTTYPRIFNCPHRAYTVQYRNTGTLLDCECNCNKPKNICTGWCIESCTGEPLYPGQ